MKRYERKEEGPNQFFRGRDLGVSWEKGRQRGICKPETTQFGQAEEDTRGFPPGKVNHLQYLQTGREGTIRFGLNRRSGGGQRHWENMKKSRVKLIVGTSLEKFGKNRAGEGRL